MLRITNLLSRPARPSLPTRTNAARLREEFPWVWALKSEWSPLSPLRAGTITDLILLGPCRDEAVDAWWIKSTFCGTTEVIKQIPADINSSLAKAIVATLGFFHNLTDLVLVEKSGMVTIWRAPSDRNLHDMCAILSKSST